MSWTSSLPVALFSADPTLLVVPAGSPWKTLAEFLADAKARPGAISYGSSGNYSALHVPVAMLTTAAGIELLHVPFQGGGPALTALLGGQVQAHGQRAGADRPAYPRRPAAGARLLGRQRLPGYEAVPTLLESGFPEAEFYIWAGVFAPAGTPPPAAGRTPPGAAARGGGCRGQPRPGRRRQYRWTTARARPSRPSSGPMPPGCSGRCSGSAGSNSADPPPAPQNPSFSSAMACATRSRVRRLGAWPQALVVALSPGAASSGAAKSWLSPPISISNPEGDAA